MVWFQCEDCGENLKKPKLPGHFRICSAFKLSCIDCGVTFGQQSVQGHNQCITEAEKYGPKGQGKATNNSAAKPKNDASKQKSEIDTTVGLSERPPWFCKLCNSKATSKQALLLHADGKKHRAKARAFHAANQKPSLAEEANSKDVSSNVEESNQNVSSAEAENVNSLPFKKRKLEQSENGIVKTGSSSDDKLDCGEVIQVEEKLPLKKAKQNIEVETNEDTEKKIKWKKLIKSSLQTNPEGILKMKKLRKLVLESLRESGIKEDETQLIGALELKVNSSSRFNVDGKYVHLVLSKS